MRIAGAPRPLGRRGRRPRRCWQCSAGWASSRRTRPCASDENAYAESLLRTAKYRPEFPVKGFETLKDARTWAGPASCICTTSGITTAASAMSAPPSGIDGGEISWMTDATTNLTRRR